MFTVDEAAAFAKGRPFRHDPDAAQFFIKLPEIAVTYGVWQMAGAKTLVAHLSSVIAAGLADKLAELAKEAEFAKALQAFDPCI